MTVKQKKKLGRILAAAVLLIALHFIPLTGIWQPLVYLIPYFVGRLGYPVESHPQYRSR